tara:strand:- start:11950 stop:12360 length:411 start_codon:yes stop_codon:yes gene_type:complete
MVKWTKDEEEQIIQGWPVKEHRDAIAEELGRSKAACATRYRKLIKETPVEEFLELISTGDAYVEKVREKEEEITEAVEQIIVEQERKMSVVDYVTDEGTPEYLSTITTSENTNKIVNAVFGCILLGIIGYIIVVFI